MKEFVAPYAYLMEDDSERKNAKETKKSVIKHGLIFGNYKNCMLNEQQAFTRYTL